MINGERAREEASRVDSHSPDRADDLRDSKSDGGKESLPWYSSCEDPELERYTRENSVMGTPSLCSCSSVVNYGDCLGKSEFGSSRSMGLVNDGGLDGFSLGDRKAIKMNADDSSVSRIDPRLKDNCSGDSKEKKPSDREEIAWSVIKFNGESWSKEDEREDLSPNGRSEDEKSMYGERLEDEGKIDFTYSINTIQNSGKTDYYNPLLMNSSVAFGSNDWDDFTLETAENSGDGLIFEEFQRKREVSYHTMDDSPEDLCIPFEEPHYEETSNTSGVSAVDPKVENSTMRNSPFLGKGTNQVLHVEDEKGNKDTPLTSSNEHAIIDESEEYLNGCSITNVFEPGQDSITDISQQKPDFQLDLANKVGDEQHSFSSTEKLTGIKDGLDLEAKYLEDIADPLYLQDDVKSHHYPKATEIKNSELQDDAVMSSSTTAIMTSHHSSKVKDLAFSADIFEDQISQEEAKAVELNGYIDDVINDMEEILLDVGESPRLQKDQKLSRSQLGLASRDAGSTASTSGNEDAVDVIDEKMLRIDGVEVIGARQKKGEVSLSERLVGVKEYTVYRIKVWGGDHNWEVERRYRDFLTLHRQMKALFSDEGWVLPPPWSVVDKESRKIFGSASPDVVAERSEIIQECLRSIIHSSSFTDLSPCFIWFLSPEESNSSLSDSRGLIRQSTFSSTGTDVEILSPLGKTIPLIVEVRPQKSLKQLLDAQHSRCAGCHRHFDDSKTLMRDFMQILGWGKPRVCEYTGQLFCSVCHTNETTVLPARVLHYWDFTEYPVCQLSKSYLDSINDQPMLCIGAVNPFLFSRVPAILHVMNLRKKIGSMLPCIRCPFRLSVNRGLGSRKYLLESDDFFALRDLIDLSKGPFAALPVMLETVSKKIREHIMERCLICCDLGVPCGAKQACADPSSLIFPFQENELEKCRYCQAVYHQKCFEDLGKCSCQSETETAEALSSQRRNDNSSADDASGVQDLQLRSSGSILPSELLSTLFHKTMSGTAKRQREGDNVLVMGSLPSTSL
ncbi:hypothetical protein MLD38_039436 [Melastoma candidum]|uniref:Uncharacterized protein n=1 Tax=Melastoma candidum TaxID=119954 RepID=A0ACB9L3A4_9MYRT|nr:hypothetical protein MLD38_039436 [Melastoma candidum]